MSSTTVVSSSSTNDETSIIEGQKKTINSLIIALSIIAILLVIAIILAIIFGLGQSTKSSLTSLSSNASTLPSDCPLLPFEGCQVIVSVGASTVSNVFPYDFSGNNLTVAANFCDTTNIPLARNQRWTFAPINYDSNCSSATFVLIPNANQSLALIPEGSEVTYVSINYYAPDLYWQFIATGNTYQGSPTFLVYNAQNTSLLIVSVIPSQESAILLRINVTDPLSYKDDAISQWIVLPVLSSQGGICPATLECP